MDFDNVSFSATKSLASNETTNQENLYGSGIFFKQEYLSGENTVNEGDLRGLKVSKTIAFDDFSAPKALQKSSLLRSNSNNSHGSQMLCFSSPNSSQSVTFPFYHPSSNAITAAYGSEYLNGGSMQGSKGYFTPSQWMELEHQALIYKYIHANVPVPSSLLIPIRKSLDSVRFSGFMGLKPSTFGLGAYQLGFSNSPDPEPGRCRRTDGKKWRCSKDAMSDHKYCERHTNRGRRRSRKPVEDQSGHSVTGTRTTSTVKQMPLPMASSTSAAMVAGGAGSDSSRCYSIPKPQNANHESSSTGEFGQVWFDSLMNPFKKSSSEEETKGTISAKQQNGLHQFFTNWSNSDSKSSWQDMNMNSERTQLSISIPSTNSDFMSSTSSSTNEKASSSPSNHSRNRREASWIPVNWESSSMGGGPLAEVLKNTNNNNNSNNNLVDDKAAPSLNLMMAGGGWDGNVSPYMASSPTGVLQKAAFLSSSNSSTGSSPRTNSICSNVFVSSLKNLLLPNL